MATVAEIKTELDARGVTYPADAKKPALEQLLVVSAGTTSADVAAPRTSAAKHAAVAIERIDAKIGRLQERRERLTRIEARERSGGSAGSRQPRRTRKGGTAS